VLIRYVGSLSKARGYHSRMTNHQKMVDTVRSDLSLRKSKATTAIRQKTMVKERKDKYFDTQTAVRFKDNFVSNINDIRQHLLVLDGHVSREHVILVEMGRSNNITMVTCSIRHY